MSVSERKSSRQSTPVPPGGWVTLDSPDPDIGVTVTSPHQIYRMMRIVSNRPSILPEAIVSRALILSQGRSSKEVEWIPIAPADSSMDAVQRAIAVAMNESSDSEPKRPRQLPASRSSEPDMSLFAIHLTAASLALGAAGLLLLATADIDIAPYVKAILAAAMGIAVFIVMRSTSKRRFDTEIVDLATDTFRHKRA